LRAYTPSLFVQPALKELDVALGPHRSATDPDGLWELVSVDETIESVGADAAESFANGALRNDASFRRWVRDRPQDATPIVF
jgi:hypothetical protein